MDKTKSNRSRCSNKLNILFSKHKLLTEHDQHDSQISLALASGDCFIQEPRCKLCSGTMHLKNISIDHCNEIISRVFDVEVPSTGKICEPCVKCLKACERFQILVNSSFVKKPHFSSPGFDQSTETEPIELPVNPQKEIINLLTASLTSKPKRKRLKTANNTPTQKRVNVACAVCQHKYLMLDQGINSNFVCSRCKRYESKIIEGKKISPLPANDLRSKNNLMGKNRLNTTVEKNPPHPVPAKLKHQCALCPKIYVDPLHLAKHVSTMHEPYYVCFICGKRLKNEKVYEKHLKLHSSSKSKTMSMDVPLDSLLKVDSTEKSEINSRS